MRTFVLRLIVNAIALAVTAALLPGIHIRDDSVGTLLIVAFIFGVVNAVIKPVLIILSCPLVILTLGLFLLALNGILLLITDRIAGNRLDIDTFWWAVLGGMIMGFVGSVLENALGINDKEDKDKDKDQVIFPA